MLFVKYISNISDKYIFWLVKKHFIVNIQMFIRHIWRIIKVVNMCGKLIFSLSEKW